MEYEQRFNRSWMGLTAGSLKPGGHLYLAFDLYDDPQTYFNAAPSEEYLTDPETIDMSGVKANMFGIRIRSISGGTIMIRKHRWRTGFTAGSSYIPRMGKNGLPTSRGSNAFLPSGTSTNGCRQCACNRAGIWRVPQRAHAGKPKEHRGDLGEKKVSNRFAA